MALLITDTRCGNPQGMPCAAVRGARLQAGAVFVDEQECQWRC